MAVNPAKNVERVSQGLELRTVLAILVTIVSWASAYAGIRAGLQAYSPEQVALLRYLTASIVLLVIAIRQRLPLPGRKDLPLIVVLGILGISIYNIALNKGESDTPAAVASVIVSSAPIFVALFAKIFLKEKLTRWAWVGITICFGGVAIISFGSGGHWDLSLSALLILAAAIAQAIYSTFQKPLLRKYSPLQFTTCAIWAGAIFLLPFLPGLVQQVGRTALSSTLPVIYLGVFPGAVGYVCWSYVLSRLPASRAGVFLYAVPPTAALIAWLWLGEIPTQLTVIGGILVLCGVIVVNTFGRAVKVTAGANSLRAPKRTDNQAQQAESS
jgi:drug/metabolite transporter (DMT)-like permease